jgi:hypothetical protein
MALVLPRLDDLDYERLRLELLGEIPLVSREYTDHNASDPGILLLELLCAMGETISYRCDQLPEHLEHNFKTMVLDRPEPVTVLLRLGRGTREVALAALPAGVDLSTSLLSEVIAFDAGRLRFDGAMLPEQLEYLRGLSAGVAYRTALDTLFDRTNVRIVIPAGLRVTGALAGARRLEPAAGSTEFETTDEVVLDAGMSALETRARHREVSAGPVALGTSNGLPAQAFDLELPNAVGALLLDARREGNGAYDPNPRVSVGGAPWSFTQTLVDRGPASTVYRVEWLPRAGTPSTQRYRFHFGDGRHGAIPPTGAAVVCQGYQLVRGRLVQVGPSALNEFVFGYQPLASLPFPAASLLGGVGYDAERKLLTSSGRLTRPNYVVLQGLSADAGFRAALDGLVELSSLTIENRSAARGGNSVYAPAELDSSALRAVLDPDRAIAARDFQTMAVDAYNASSGLTGRRVRRAHATRLDDLGSVALTVIPEPERSDDSWPSPSIELLQSVYDFVDERRVITTRLSVTGPTYRPVRVQVRAKQVLHAATTEVTSEIVRRVNALFDPLSGGLDGDGWVPGRAVHRSEIFQVLRGIEGVAVVTAVILDGQPARAMTQLRPLEFPRVAMSAADVAFDGGAP